MSITSVGDRLIHYEAVGRGEPLLFLHGWLGSWRYWWPSMQALSTHYRTFALDLWGFGDSTKEAGSYNLDAYVTMLDAFTERLGVSRPFTVVGHSLGAAVGLRFAAAHPDAVARLAAVALPLDGSLVHARLLDGDPGAVLARVLKASHPEVESELRKTDAAALSAVAAELQQADFSAAISAALMPLLLIYGETDTLVPSPNSHLPLASDNVGLVTLPASHFPMLEDGPRFNRLILEFMRAEDNPAGLSPKEFWQRRVN